MHIAITGYGTLYGLQTEEEAIRVWIVQLESRHGQSWIIYRRVDCFHTLSDQLPFAPRCPARCDIEWKNDVCVKRIREELTTWLTLLAQIPRVWQSPIFQEFISTEVNMAPPRMISHMFEDENGDLEEMDMNELFEGPHDDYQFNVTSPETEVEVEHELEEPLGFETIRPMRPSAKSQTLEDFALLKVIGKGSFGKVLQVRKKDTGAIYAMKVLRKENIIKRNQVEHTRTERQVLGYVQHPFIVGLNYAFQTSDKLYFILDYCAGGELFFHLGKVQRFCESRARFYIAEITLALEYMHSLDIIYRDLKPENVLLDECGHIKLTDFGLSKEGIQDNFSGAHSFCGTPEYLAPEILNRSGHGRAVDWWSLGALLYEMLTGLPPFYSRDRERLFDKIRKGELSYPKYLSAEAKSLLLGLLERNPMQRLGTGSEDAQEIKSHPFFKEISWTKLYHMQMEPPWRPEICDHLDTSQFDSEFTSMPLISPDSYHSSNPLLKTRTDSDALFKGFTYTEESMLMEGKF